LSASGEAIEASLLPESSPALLGPDRVGVTTPVTRARVIPLSAERTGLQFTIDKSTEAKLRYAQALLGREVPPGDVAKVPDLALDALVEKLEKKKLGATKKPRRGHKCPKAGSRRVSASVKKAVWKRDGAQCTYVSPDTGRRCEETKDLQFDHCKEFARGGEATVENMRHLCRAHDK